jgi:hypothetical protein
MACGQLACALKSAHWLRQKLAIEKKPPGKEKGKSGDIPLKGF